MNHSQILLKVGRMYLDLHLVLSVLSYFLKIGVLCLFFKLAEYSELDKVLNVTLEFDVFLLF